MIHNSRKPCFAYPSANNYGTECKMQKITGPSIHGWKCRILNCQVRWLGNPHLLWGKFTIFYDYQLSPHVSGLSETMLPRFIPWFIIIFPFRTKNSGYIQFSGTPILSYCLYHVPKINLHRIGEVNCPFIVAELCKIHHFKTQIILSWLYDIPHIPHNPHKHHHFWWFNPSFLLAFHLISFIFPIWRIP